MTKSVDLERIENEIGGIVNWAKKHNIGGFRFEEGDLKLRIEFGSELHNGQSIAQGISDISEANLLRSPSQGTFRFHHKDLPETTLLAGQQVLHGQVIGYLEVENVILPLLSPAYGTVSAVFYSNGDLVAQGCPLVAISPATL